MSAPAAGVVHRQHQLQNGLMISAEIDPQAVSAACGFFVDTGARDEPSTLMGVSHFLEHMAFKGSGELTGEAIDKAFDDLGLDHNAWTSAEATAFWIHARPDRLLEGFPILATLLRPELRGPDLEDERKVILEEIAMYEDEPFWVLIEGLLERYYAENGLGHRVLGTNITVGGITREAMSSYHTERYGPNNMMLAAAGNVDFQALVDVAESLAGHWTSAPGRPVRQTPTQKQVTFEVEKENLAQQYIVLMMPAPDRKHPKYQAASMLMQILGGSESDLLHWDLVNPGLAEHASASHDMRDGSGEFVCWAVSDPSRAEEVESRLRLQLEGLRDNISQDALSRVRARVATAAALHGELPRGRMSRIGRRWLSHRDWVSIEDEVERIQQVTMEDLHEILDEWSLEPQAVGRLRPAT